MTQSLTPEAPVANPQPLPSEGRGHSRPANDNPSVRITICPETASVAVSGHPRLGRHVTRIFLNAADAETYACTMAAELGVEVEQVEAHDTAGDDNWLLPIHQERAS